MERVEGKDAGDLQSGAIIATYWQGLRFMPFGTFELSRRVRVPRCRAAFVERMSGISSILGNTRVLGIGLFYEDSQPRYSPLGFYL